MARWNQKLVLVGIGAALLVGASGCVVEDGYGLYQGPCDDPAFDCADLDAVCAQDLVSGNTFCTITCTTSCPSPGVCSAGVCVATSGPIPPPPTGIRLYGFGCVDGLDCADADAVCLEDATTGDTFCTVGCSTSCPSPGVCTDTTEGGFCLLGSGPPPPPPGPLPFYATGCDGGANPCVSSAQCLELTNESDGSTDTFCSAGCLLDSDCGSNGWCLLQDASTSICFEACTSTADCDSAFGWMCEQVEDFETKDLVPACIPSWT